VSFNQGNCRRCGRSFTEHLTGNRICSVYEAAFEPGSQVPLAAPVAPIPMLLWCPDCFERHIDQGEFATKSHHTHACQHCGVVWRPAIVATVGVRFLPGFKDDQEPACR